MAGEFDNIKTYFAPLASGLEGSFGLTDDAAAIDVPAGKQLVITKDAIAQGVHFIGDENPAYIAQKLLRVNLSDLAAMGATPYAYFLAIMLPKHIDEAWLAGFVQGLAADQREFGITLAGGDSISSPTLAFTLTALGLVETDASLRRNGAQVGDIIYVSGTLGDAVLGLKALQEKQSGQEFLVSRYLLPQPRMALGQKLVGLASAAMDISDGLLQDLGHICAASNVAARVQRARLPLSDEARGQDDAWLAAATGGDDYELLFTAPAQMKNAVDALALQLGLPLTAIGVVVAGQGVQLLDEAGAALKIKQAGFQHF